MHFRYLVDFYEITIGLVKSQSRRLESVTCVIESFPSWEYNEVSLAVTNVRNVIRGVADICQKNKGVFFVAPVKRRRPELTDKNHYHQSVKFSPRL